MADSTDEMPDWELPPRVRAVHVYRESICESVWSFLCRFHHRRTNQTKERERIVTGIVGVVIFRF